MSGVERKSNVNMKDAQKAAAIANKYGNISVDASGKGVQDAVYLTVSAVPTMIPVTLVAMSFIFIIAGCLLLFANISDQEGFVQVFVWAIFLNICLGLLLVLVVGVQCISGSEKCYLKEMDWLSASASLTFFAAYMFLWVYFISVANSYVLQLYSR